MTCCGAPRTTDQTARTRSALCTLGRRDPACVYDAGQTDTLRKPEAACPVHPWPDGAGTVRWLGVEWIGLPWPLRLWVAILGAWRGDDGEAFMERMGAERYGGCGCVGALKQAWTGAIAILKRALSWTFQAVISRGA